MNVEGRAAADGDEHVKSFGAEDMPMAGVSAVLEAEQELKTMLLEASTSWEPSLETTR